jgi:hypothetical protein
MKLRLLGRILGAGVAHVLAPPGATPEEVKHAADAGAALGEAVSDGLARLLAAPATAPPKVAMTDEDVRRLLGGQSIGKN